MPVSLWVWDGSLMGFYVSLSSQRSEQTRSWSQHLEIVNTQPNDFSICLVPACSRHEMRLTNNRSFGTHRELSYPNHLALSGSTDVSYRNGNQQTLRFFFHSKGNRCKLFNIILRWISFLLFVMVLNDRYPWTWWLTFAIDYG